VGLLLFAYIVSTADVVGAAGLILGADRVYLAAGLLLVALEVAVRSLCWKALAGIYAGGYRYSDALQAYMIGIAFGSVTPGKAGDLVKVTDLRDRMGLDMTKAFTVGLLDRLINFMFLFISAGAAAAAVAMTMAGLGDSLLPVIVFMAAFIPAVFVVLNERVSSALLRPLQAFLVPERFRGDTKSLFRTFHKTVGEFRRSRSRSAVAALMLLGWLIIFARPYFFGRALGMDVGWWTFMLFIPIVSAVEVLPLSIMGLGTRDASILFLFGLMGVDRERMVALSAMILLLSLLPQVVAGYLIAWSRKVTLEYESTAR